VTAVPLLDPGCADPAPASPGLLRPPLGPVPVALAAIARGEPVVVLDDAGRENEGDLIVAAELATAASLAFMVRHTSGLICVAMTGDRLDQLDIPLMVGTNTDGLGTAFTVSVDHRASTTTGISAADRAATIRALIDPTAGAGDFARPGHVFPLRADPMGVLGRRGHTEAAVDLARLAGLAPAGVLGEIVNDDGTMARADDLVRFTDDHGLVLVTVGDLVAFRRRRECLVRHLSTASLPTESGRFTVHAFGSLLDGVEHVALVRGEVADRKRVLTRVHRECLTGDVFASTGCRCDAHLRSAMARIASEETGIVVYVRGRESDGTVAAHILRELGVASVRLMTDDTVVARDLAACGVDVVECIAPKEKGDVDNGAPAAPDRPEPVPTGSRPLSHRRHRSGLGRRR
jgi:3,4-dihydroxy 2-butanone 4-phosphate synthase / GTP cyclohydrolase II